MEWAPEDRSPAATYHFLTSAVAPRPIAWVTTRSKQGVVNAAPFSWFQAVCADPPMVMLSIVDKPGGVLKDTARNIQENGQFVVNAATRKLADAIVASSLEYAPDESEVEALGLATEPSQVVVPPRLADSPFHLECRLADLRRYGRDKAPVSLIIGEVVHIAADDDVLDDRGNVDPVKACLLARLGGAEYLSVDSTFAIRRPERP